MWTKSVLMFGAGAVALLLLLQLLPLDYIYLSPLSPPRGSLFGGLGAVVEFWIFLLATAIVRDYIVSRRDRNIVRPFAKRFSRELRDDSPVTQLSDQSAISTSTSGLVDGRVTSATYREYAGSRIGPELRVDVQCHCPWTLEISRNNFLARLVARAGSRAEIGDPELDEAIVVQGDDAAAIRNWLREPAVRSRVLSLFQQCKVDSISVVDEGSTLRAAIRVRNQLVAPPFDADAITEALSVLADTLERR